MAVPAVKHNRGEKLNAENLRAALGNGPVPHRFLLIRPFFSKGCPAQRPGSRTAPIAATAALAIIQAWPSRKLGSRSLGFDYLASIVGTMLRLNPLSAAIAAAASRATAPKRSRPPRSQTMLWLAAFKNSTKHSQRRNRLIPRYDGVFTSRLRHNDLKICNGNWQWLVANS
jgi:hypothetical protein